MNWKKRGAALAGLALAGSLMIGGVAHAETNAAWITEDNDVIDCLPGHKSVCGWEGTYEVTSSVAMAPPPPGGWSQPYLDDIYDTATDMVDAGVTKQQDRSDGQQCSDVMISSVAYPLDMWSQSEDTQDEYHWNLSDGRYVYIKQETWTYACHYDIPLN